MAKPLNGQKGCLLYIGIDQIVLSRILQDEKSEERKKQIEWNIFNYSDALKAELDFFSKCKYNNSDIPDEIKRFKETVTEIYEYAKNDVWRTE